MALLSGTACQFTSAPNVGQSSGNSRNVDAGSADGEALQARRVAAASGDFHSDADVDAKVDAGGGEAGKGGGKPARPAENGGGADGSTPVDNKAKSDDSHKPAPDKKEQEPAQHQKQSPPTDAGSPGEADGGALPNETDAATADGGQLMVDDPFGVLDGLAERTAGGKTAVTIKQFIEALGKGDAPAANIQEFLLAIDAEVDCKKNRAATECVAACQAVGSTCAMCVFDEPCRNTLLDICGYAALAGCSARP
jgi:hypothetical protein